MILYSCVGYADHDVEARRTLWALDERDARQQCTKWEPGGPFPTGWSAGLQWSVVPWLPDIGASHPAHAVVTGTGGGARATRPAEAGPSAEQRAAVEGVLQEWALYGAHPTLADCLSRLARAFA